MFKGAARQIPAPSDDCFPIRPSTQQRLYVIEIYAWLHDDWMSSNIQQTPVMIRSSPRTFCSGSQRLNLPINIWGFFRCVSCDAQRPSFAPRWTNTTRGNGRCISKHSKSSSCLTEMLLGCVQQTPWCDCLKSTPRLTKRLHHSMRNFRRAPHAHSPLPTSFRTFADTVVSCPSRRLPPPRYRSYRLHLTDSPD